MSGPRDSTGEAPAIPEAVNLACQAVIDAMRAAGMVGRLLISTADDDAVCPNCAEHEAAESGAVGFGFKAETGEMCIFIDASCGRKAAVMTRAEMAGFARQLLDACAATPGAPAPFAAIH